MSLPRYVINFEELLDNLKISKPELDYETDTGIQYSKGFCLNSKDKILEWNPSDTIALTSITLGKTSISTENTAINIYITSKDNTIIWFDKKFIKDVIEVNQLLTHIILQPTDKLQFEIINTELQTNIFVDIDYIKIVDSHR